jgi:hypothetical protein
VKWWWIPKRNRTVSDKLSTTVYGILAHRG